jgi:hypothetical protein
MPDNRNPRTGDAGASAIVHLGKVNKPKLTQIAIQFKPAAIEGGNPGATIALLAARYPNVFTTQLELVRPARPVRQIRRPAPQQ